MNSWFRSQGEQFRRDVWSNPTVGPSAAFLLSVLASLIYWLTITYAPEAHLRGTLPSSHDGSGAISPEWGRRAVYIMTVLTLLAGFEPRISRWWREKGRRCFQKLHPIVRVPLGGIALLLLGTMKIASFVWSLVDYVLARPIAILAGAKLPGSLARYAWFAMILAGTAVLSIIERGEVGLWAIVAGLVVIVAVVRRWTWIEADRNTFLIQRGGDRGSAMRIGFKEDLRDEALVALTCLFVLIPLGLDLVQETTCLDKCAFKLERDAPMPTDLQERLLIWLGFFGAELAKTVPFVDWSEVFHVANGSPIKPQTAMGSQITFVLRAGLDLLFLAAVLQALGIASRVREQDAAFRANRLPILDPFSEARVLSAAAAEIEPALEVRPVDQPAISSFPHYDDTRLRELINANDGRIDLLVAKAAVALLAGKHAGEATDLFLFERSRDPRLHPELRDWILSTASGLAPERANADRVADRERLNTLLQVGTVPVRRAAARRLGRFSLAETSVGLLMDRLRDASEDPGVRADAAVALAKLAPGEDVRNLTLGLASMFKGQITDEPLLAVMATAHAIARLNRSASAAEVASNFDEPLREHATRAAQIKVEPLNFVEGKATQIGAHTDQMVAIPPGHFTLGRSFSASEVGARKDQQPATQMTIERAFAFGRFPVTNREFRGFCNAMGIAARPQSVNSAAAEHHPVVQVSWYEANAYGRWLERITGERYRLPTEAEWEYACRAGTNTLYWWGDDFSKGHDYRNPDDVNTDSPNPWGIWSLYGHVYEWCADPWHGSHHGRPTDSRVWLENCDATKRVVRGGSFNWPRLETAGADKGKETRRRELRSSYRNEQVPGHIQTNYGFRIVRSLSS